MICEQFKAKMSDIKHMISITESFYCVCMLSVDEFWAPNFGGKLGSRNVNVKPLKIHRSQPKLTYNKCDI